MFIPIRGDHARTNKKWVALMSYKRVTTKQLTIEIKSESETNVETDVDLGHQDVAMLLVGQLLCHRCHQFFSGRKGGCSRGKRRASLPTPPHFSGANLLLVWGFGSCWCLSDGNFHPTDPRCLDEPPIDIIDWFTPPSIPGFPENNSSPLKIDRILTGSHQFLGASCWTLGSVVYSF